LNAYKKYRNRIEKYLQTERGKRLINFSYSIGAAIVILGAMFKLLHFPYGNELLFIGMITEVIVFTLSAFDTPIRDYNWDRIFPALTSDNSDDQPNININSTTEKELKDQQTETSHKPDDHQHYKETYKTDRKSTRLNSSHVRISYAVFCLKKKKKKNTKYKVNIKIIQKIKNKNIITITKLRYYTITQII